VLVILTVAVVLLSTACGCWLWEPRAPQRPFTVQDLLMDQEIVPPGWELSDPVFSVGDTLCTTECYRRGFRVSSSEGSIRYGRHNVYRYLSAGIAQRTFDHVYLAMSRSLEPTSEWTYQSPVAERSHFGCVRMGGPANLFCEWGAQYEEFIVTFGVGLSSDELSPADREHIEEIVRAIDARMEHYLNEPTEEGD